VGHCGRTSRRKKAIEPWAPDLGLSKIENGKSEIYKGLGFLFL